MQVISRAVHMGGPYHTGRACDTAAGTSAILRKTKATAEVKT